MIGCVRILLRTRSEKGVNSLGHEIRGICHHANARPFGRMRSKTHLQRQVLGGPPEIVDLFSCELVHDLLPVGTPGVTGCVVTAHP